MRKREQDAHEKKLRAGFVRLLFAARNLASRLRYCHAGEAPLYCSVCAVRLAPEAGEWLPIGPHADNCPVGQVAAVLAELMRTATVEELGRGLEGELEPDPAAVWLAAARRERACRPGGGLAGLAAPFSGLVSDSGSLPGFPSVYGGPGGGRWGRTAAGGLSGSPGRLAPGRKPPVRAGSDGAEAVAIEVSAAASVDFGEPWRLVAVDGALAVLDRADKIKFFLSDENDPNIRRVVAAVNLCAGGPTEALENAFDEIASTSPRWALLAVNISVLTRAHIAMLRDYIDEVVKQAAGQNPAWQAGATGRPQ
jgi:hypothetical protein